MVLYINKIPEKAKELTVEQVVYLGNLARILASLENWNADELQTALFAAAKEIELQQSQAFKAIYLSLLGKERGPKAGALLSYLDRPFVIQRFQDLSSA